ncbi:formate dehydrogenase accessory sulfurtransferase FdhD [Methanoplanus sp. FWC-SCC4]|uniref:Formate dehydrogenase accessory sulfurtransferase FdhD n=1 Tax=Methanochimaera problematica TaxID=2609417 RepID=A0AA97I4I9_9EURY|nr:formate dehydrogenase accessory sulfurtransferase FdhD [Methanoplanus sp. FWC-SCC4]WOF16559.1 formate dehydrogenase accessory sulfurtransferase FdhD [Methanoplanus sp. FWC-SCC4]
MVLKEVQAIQVNEDSANIISDYVVNEDTISIYINNDHITTQVATLMDLRELGAGFAISEGLCEHVDRVDSEGEKIYVYADISGEIKPKYCSSGGTSMSLETKCVTADITIDQEDIFRATKEIISDTWKKTGGVHCSVLFKDKEIISKMSDIGRHNTVDKVIGFAELNNIDRSKCYLGCTGRQPSGMVSKCANANIPVIISKSASTTEGIMTAQKTGLTLVCFARDRRFTIYANPERIRGIKLP